MSNDERLRGSKAKDAAPVAASERANQERWSAQDDAWRGYFYVDGRLQLEDRMVEAIKILTPARDDASATMLDVGCANGILTRVVAEAFGARSIAAIDFVDQIDTTRSAGEPPIAFQVVNLDGTDPLPFPDSSFDLVTCFETIEHLHDTDRMLAEFRRVLRPGAQLIVSVPRIDGALSILMLLAGLQPPAVECSIRRRYGSPDSSARVSGHVANFTLRALKELLAANGFEVVATRQASIYSGWTNAAPRPSWQKLPLWALSKIPIKQDVMVVRAVARG